MLLPLYLLGNLHCMGMCGPLVMMIGRHEHKYWYFLGRTLSFTLAATLAGAFGTLLQELPLGPATTFVFGGLIIALGIGTWREWHISLPSSLAKLSNSLSILALRDLPLPIFLFGFFTVFLPCGQSLLVFSACALSTSPWVGMFNGFTFALLTSPSLFFSMKAHSLFRTYKSLYPPLMGGLSILIGGLGILRGLADLGILSHFTISETLHLALY